MTMTSKYEMTKWADDNLSKEAPLGINLKIGDSVRWVNDNGVEWEHKVIGFNVDRWFNKEYEKFVHLDTECYWFPHAADSLQKTN